MYLVLQQFFCGAEGKRKLSGSFKLAFLSAALIAGVTHLFAFTNLLINHDSLSTMYSVADYLRSGRWAIKYVALLRGNFEITGVIAIIAVVMMALAAGFTVRCIRLQDKVSILFAAAFCVTFPTAASVLAYANEWYFTALMLSAMGAYCTQRYRYGWIAGILLIAVSCGIYQSYLSYAIGLLLLDRLFALYSDEPLKDIVKKGLLYVGTLFGAVVLYYVILQMLLKVEGISLLSYKGIDTIGFSNLGNYLASIPRAYSDYGRFFLDSAYLGKPAQLLQVIFLLLSLFAAGTLVIWKKLYREKARVVLITLGMLLIPPALSITSILVSQEVNINILNQYAYLLQFIFCLKFFEMFGQEAKGRLQWGNVLLQLFSFAVCVVLCWSNVILNNQAYLRMNLCYENTMALANRITMRVEETEGYIPMETPVAFVGGPSSEYFFLVQKYFADTGVNVVTGTDFSSLLGTYSTRVFFNYFVGATLVSPSQEQKDAILQSGILNEMPCYPLKDSVQYVDGVVIVKLGESDVIR